MTTDKLTDERLQELLEYPLRIQIGEHLDIITELLRLRGGLNHAKEVMQIDKRDLDDARTLLQEPEQLESEKP